jgi:hypothetical protein
MDVCFNWYRKSLVLFVVLAFFPIAQATTLLYSTAPGGMLGNGYQGATYSTPFGDPFTIRGHFIFKNGLNFGIFNTVTWDADGLVNGLITIPPNTAALTLVNDLRLGSTVAFVSGATINGGGKRIVMGGDIQLDQGIALGSDLTDLTIDGNGHTLKVIGVSILGNAGTLTLKNMTLVYDNTGPTNYYLFRQGNYILENVKIRCVPYSGSYATLFSEISSGVTANLTIRGKVVIESPGMPIVVCTTAINRVMNVPIFIEKNSSLTIEKNTVLALCNQPGPTCSISMTDRTSVLHLNGCDFYTSTDGSTLTALNLTKGSLVLENKVRIFNSLVSLGGTFTPSGINTDMTKAFILGDGTAANDVDVRVLGAAYATVYGCMKYNHS